ncbi:TIGR01777 family oxidoreductase [Gillisia sp. Q332]|uniref:TIGR01777 family oxidoreductase n=1 Tax=Gillisia xinjiangensis TaxID=3384765 RepID=UPI00391BB500
MRILISGATGLVGSHITQLCKEKGISVNYLTTSKEKIKDQPENQGFFWNPASEEIDEACFKGVDAIIHLAGASVAKRWTSSYKKEIIESRVKSAALLHKSIQNLNFKILHFISASAIGVYASSYELLYFEEDKAVDDSFLGEVVVRWEKAADEFKDLGMEVSKIRIGLVLAKEGGALPKMKEPVSLNLGTAFGSGRQWQSWIHVDDLAGIFIHVLENKLAGVYNGVAPNPVTNKELMDEIAGRLNKSIWLPNVPAFALKLSLGEMSRALLASQRVSSDKIERTGFEFKYKNLPKALEDLV